ncbi:MAG: sulfur carrier protein ThiS adenylyltransferase ThiF [Bacteroidales bacterium]|jgi:sulfur carrier protein ThiS adenylyltransferase|nr:sulfur carrier protein ThiS adenylyltransferase ThiF [Bacteroidales bacterium]
MRFEEIKEHLGMFRVGIAGAGGLGSNCAVALARSGVGTLVIADYDIVEMKNLNRQYYLSDQVGMLKVKALRDNIARINPETVVVTYADRLDRNNIPGIFAGCDIVVEAFDSAEMKEIITEVVQVRMPGVPLILGSGMAGYGSNDTIRSRKIDDMLYVCGDESTQAEEDLPPMAPRVGIVAAMQANLAVELLMKMD